jgi:alpha-tubulin suppressor-like RCC1 family protein
LNKNGSIEDFTIDDSSTIKQIEFFLDFFIEDVVCGEFYCITITNKGEIFAWGKNYFGQLGNGESGEGEEKLTPIKIFKI